MIHHKGKILMTSVGAQKLFVLIFPASCNQNQRNSGFLNLDFWYYIGILHINRISCFDNQLFLSILRDFSLFWINTCKSFSVRYWFLNTSSSYKSNRLCKESKHPLTCKTYDLFHRVYLFTLSYRKSFCPISIANWLWMQVYICVTGIIL